MIRVSGRRFAACAFGSLLAVTTLETNGAVHASAQTPTTTPTTTAPAPLPVKTLTFRLEEQGPPAATGLLLECTTAKVNGRSYTTRLFSAPDRIIQYPLQPSTPATTCDFVVESIIDDEVLSVTANSAPVNRLGAALLDPATKETRARFGPITVDDVEVVIRTRSVPTKAFGQQIETLIGTKLADQFRFTSEVFGCVGVVWNAKYASGTTETKTFPGVTAAQCKVRFEAIPGQNVVTDFRTHTFAVNGRIVTPQFGPDGSALLDLPLSQFGSVVVLAPAARAAPLNGAETSPQSGTSTNGNTTGKKNTKVPPKVVTAGSKLPSRACFNKKFVRVACKK
jgi:hypothetical protein